MSDVEKSVKGYNRRMDKEKSRAKSRAKMEKLVDGLRERRDGVKQKIENIKNSIEQRRQARREVIEEQKRLDSIYDEYLQFAEENKHKIGTYETVTLENGETVEVVYTEYGPLIKGEDYYEGFIPNSKDEHANLVYSKLRQQKLLRFGKGSRGDAVFDKGVNVEIRRIDGVVRDFGLVQKVSEDTPEIWRWEDYDRYKKPPVYKDTELSERFELFEQVFENEKKKAVELAQQQAEGSSGPS